MCDDLTSIDSMLDTSMVNEQKLNSQPKHIEIKYYFIRDKAEKKDLEISYMPPEELMVDALTKTFP